MKKPVNSESRTASFGPFGNQERFPNQIKRNYRTNDSQKSDESLREFLHNKLPRKHASQGLLSSIRKKIKSYHV
jgi:hypothetical protein